jgi:hypothetical protein
VDRTAGAWGNSVNEGELVQNLPLTQASREFTLWAERMTGGGRKRLYPGISRLYPQFTGLITIISEIEQKENDVVRTSQKGLPT